MAAKTNPLKILMLVSFSISILLSVPKTAVAIPTGDLDGLLLLLRANGHTLFANAISTSDLLFDLLSVPSLTLLAPTDPALFALDMTQTPPFYLSTLRLHALPRRLSWADLLQLPNNFSLPTLLPSRDLRVNRGEFGNVLVGGVPVVMPGLYYGPDVAVHGLAGIITFRSPTPSSSNHQPPVNHTTVIPPLPKIARTETNRKNRTVSPPVNRTVFFPHFNHTTVLPVPTTTRIPMNRRGRVDSYPPVASPLPEVPSNQTNGMDSTKNNRIVLTPFLAPGPGPEGLYGYSPAEPRDDLDFLMGKSSGFDEYKFEESSPAPMTTNLMRSRELCEAFLGREICTVG